MTASHEQGPFLSYGFNPPSGLGQTGDYNSDAGPNCSYQGDCVMDPRYPFGGPTGATGGLAAVLDSAAGRYSTGVSWSGFFNSPYIQMMDVTPIALSSTIIAATANISVNTTLTPGIGLTNTTVPGLLATTLGAVAAGYPMYGAAPDIKAKVQSAGASTPVLAIEGVYAPLTVGPQAIHDPTKSSARVLTLTSAGNLSTVTVTIHGYDIYGYKMTESHAGPNANTVTLKKAWKYILNVTVSATNAATLSIGTSDIFGFHIRNVKWEYLNLFAAQAFVTTSTGWTTADQTNPATGTTGDVRGTYALQTASTGTTQSGSTGTGNNGNRFAFFLSIPLSDAVGAFPAGGTANVAAGTGGAYNYQTLFGIPQFNDGTF